MLIFLLAIPISLKNLLIMILFLGCERLQAFSLLGNFLLWLWPRRFEFA